MFETLQHPFNELSRDQFPRQCARQGYEPRSPMYARRFIEFAFSTPERIRLRGHTRKHVHVHALQDLLPEKVRNRRTKADFSLAFERHLDKMGNALVSTLPAAGCGYLSQGGMKRLYDYYCASPVGERPIWELWGAFSCAGPLDLSRVKAASTTREICYDSCR
jgi:asparagine synthase (glutamine-hydrolysing)